MVSRTEEPGLITRPFVPLTPSHIILLTIAPGAKVEGPRVHPRELHRAVLEGPGGASAFVPAYALTPPVNVCRRERRSLCPLRCVIYLNVHLSAITSGKIRIARAGAHADTCLQVA